MFRNNLTISNNSDHATTIVKGTFLSVLVVSATIPFFLMVPEANPAIALVVDPAAAIEALITDIVNLDGEPNGVRQSLIAQLNVALRFISDDNTANDHISCTKLDTFTTKVNDFESKGLLTAGQADEMRQQGFVILDVIGCDVGDTRSAQDADVAAGEMMSTTTILPQPSSDPDDVQSAISLPH